MIRTIFSIAILGAFAAASLQAEPPSKKRSSSKKNEITPKVVPAAPLVSGWTYANGQWTHIDGYKLLNGKVVRSSGQTHKKAPLPPTKAEMEAVMNKTSGIVSKTKAKTPAEIAAEKEAQRQRNLMPSRSASQTGSHL